MRFKIQILAGDAEGQASFYSFFGQKYIELKRRNTNPPRTERWSIGQGLKAFEIIEDESVQRSKVNSAIWGAAVAGALGGILAASATQDKKTVVAALELGDGTRLLVRMPAKNFRKAMKDAVLKRKWELENTDSPELQTEPIIQGEANTQAGETEVGPWDVAVVFVVLILGGAVVWYFARSPHEPSSNVISARDVCQSIDRRIVSAGMRQFGYEIDLSTCMISLPDGTSASELVGSTSAKVTVNYTLSAPTEVVVNRQLEVRMPDYIQYRADIRWDQTRNRIQPCYSRRYIPEFDANGAFAGWHQGELVTYDGC